MLTLLTAEGSDHEKVIRELHEQLDVLVSDNPTIIRTLLSETMAVIDYMPYHAATLLVEYETSQPFFVPLGNGLYARRDMIILAHQNDDGTLTVGCANYKETVQPDQHHAILRMVGAVE